MNFNTKNLLAVFAMVIVFSLTGSHLKAQFSYELIDTADGIDVTYDSSMLIQAQLTASVTAANSDVYQLNFALDQPVYSGHTGGGGIVFAIATPQVTPTTADVLTLSNVTTNQQIYSYYFNEGAFDALGTYSSFNAYDPGVGLFSRSGELIVSQAPEPSTWCLIAVGTIALLGWAARRRAVGIA